MAGTRHMCARCGNTEEFYTTAQVSQTWKVDGYGNFIEEISTDEIIEDPDDDNIWECAYCGEDAVIVDD